MCKTDIEKFETALKVYGKSISSSKRKSEDYLVRIGVVTKKGNLSKHYKNLCTPQGPV
jgi:hypothetical protein